jgi:hypothetical protein
MQDPRCGWTTHTGSSRRPNPDIRLADKMHRVGLMAFGGRSWCKVSTADGIDLLSKKYLKHTEVSRGRKDGSQESTWGKAPDHFVMAKGRKGRVSGTGIGRTPAHSPSEC